ncbi:hypothetical protein [Chryseobacterium jejuense]|uniref:DUF3592 domain-containing protein n=1 Tax=Chryseobacterium jejuense TaxID=445960 RepID=A0A2X2X1Y8_CHRJE|nr:hypothetical protein [Chryseobacterium jejuense]SDJ39668.1 hypothetical protein SAMN05421542_3427 [Chryseobacterium jejuense]SQB45927.1 Uncharacterised protein [Chryseobacterium jejuense]
MGNKIYSKNQVFIIAFLLIGFLYTTFSFFGYEKTIKEGTQVETLVINQSCRTYEKLQSGVMISVGGKAYNVKLDYGNCIKYPVNSKIKVVYNKERDIFIFPVKTYNTGRIYFLGVLLLLSILPWSYIFRKK